MRRVLLAVKWIHGTYLHHAVNLRRVPHRIQNHHQSSVGVPEQIHLTDSEMLPDCFQVVHVVMDAPFQFFAVAYGVRAAAIAKIKKDERAALSKMLEVVKQIKPVGDYHRLRAVPQLLNEQTRSIRRLYVIFGWQHLVRTKT